MKTSIENSKGFQPYLADFVIFLTKRQNLDKMSKLKTAADDKMNVIQKLKFHLGRVENIVGNEENAGYQHFLLFPQCFEKLSFSMSLKVGIVLLRVNQLPSL